MLGDHRVAAPKHLHLLSAPTACTFARAFACAAFVYLVDLTESRSFEVSRVPAFPFHPQKY